MIHITDRQQRLIQLVGDGGAPKTGASLAAELGVSARTVQGEVRSLNRKAEGLIRSSNRGYELDMAVYDRIAQDLFLEAEYDLASELMRRLLFAERPLHVDELADELFVSTPTLTRAVATLNSRLRGMRIVRERNLLTLDGSERRKRGFIRRMLGQEADTAFTSLESLERYFPDIDVPRVDTIVADAISRHGHSTSNPYYANLLMNIVIALYRMRGQHYLPDEHDDAELSDDELAIARDICMQYAEHWGLEPTDADITYVALLLTGQIRKDEDSAAPPQESSVQELMETLAGMLDHAFSAYRLYIDYSGNLYGLALHIDSMIKRARAGQPAENVLLPSLKVDAPFVYDVAVKIAWQLSERYGIEVSDDEIGFICVHIGFMVEESRHDANKVQVAVVDTDYHRIGARLRDRLEANYPDLIDVYPINPALTYQLDDAKTDVIVSTHTLADNPKVVVVTPFYTQADALAVSERVLLAADRKRSERLRRVAARAFDERFFFRVPQALSRDEAIALLADALVAEGVVSKGFGELVLRREALSSTCFFDSFAIPHSTEMDARQTTLAVLLSDKGVQWGKSTVRLVIMIAVCQDDRRDFMALYEGMVQTLQNPDKLQRLLRAHNLEEFLQVLL